MPHLEKGYVQLYTGEGKGKDHGSTGTGIQGRRLGTQIHHHTVHEGMPCGELESAKRMGGLITMEQYGSADFCRARRR